MLSDTANALEDKKRELIKSLHNNADSAHSSDSDKLLCGNTFVLATIDSATYSTIPPKVQSYIHQWMDITASIGPSQQHADTTPINQSGINATSQSTWELVLKNMGMLGDLSGRSGHTAKEEEFSFDFRVVLCEDAPDEYGSTWSSYQIVWAV